jgi:hypothetical protein
MAEGWQVRTAHRFDESVCRVWGGNGSVSPCVLKGEVCNLAIDVLELRVTPQGFEHGRRRPARGTLTVAVSSDQVWHALKELTRSRQAVVLQRPDGDLEMRFSELTTTVAPLATAATSSTATFSWQALAPRPPG